MKLIICKFLQVNTVSASKYTQKKVIRHINNNFNDFSYCDESDEEEIVLG